MSMRLADAMKRIDEQNDPLTSSLDVELQEFVTEVDRIGGEIMQPISTDEYVGAVSFIKSGIIVDLIQDGKAVEASFLMTHMEVFDSIVAIAMRLSVGLAAMEEWR